MRLWRARDLRTRINSPSSSSASRMTTTPPVTIAVEGDLDEQVAVRLVEEAGGMTSHVYGKRGKPWLRAQIGGYRNAAQYSRWVVLVDLDRDECPPELRNEWGVNGGAEALCFRVAVPSIESWLLADRENIASFLGVARAHIPLHPDSEVDAKQALINVARRSRRGTIREAIVPRPTARVGPLYTSTLSQFVDERWDPARAAGASPSLARCRSRLAELVRRPMPA